jgi:hypothetical protein
MSHKYARGGGKNLVQPKEMGMSNIAPAPATTVAQVTAAPRPEAPKKIAGELSPALLAEINEAVSPQSLDGDNFVSFVREALFGYKKLLGDIGTADGARLALLIGQVPSYAAHLRRELGQLAGSGNLPAATELYNALVTELGRIDPDKVALPR